SRRRHTISTRDWSSDVCSSDLGVVAHDSQNDSIAGRSVIHQVGQQTIQIVQRLAVDGDDNIAVHGNLNTAHGFGSCTAVYASQRSEERRVGKERNARTQEKK